MKMTNMFLAIILIIIVTACSKVNNRDMTVIKDCTGSYLRFHGNDYRICNIEIVENYDDGTEVEASFKKIDDCPDYDEAMCEMLHLNEGWINVTKIK